MASPTPIVIAWWEKEAPRQGQVHHVVTGRRMQAEITPFTRFPPGWVMWTRRGRFGTG